MPDYKAGSLDLRSGAEEPWTLGSERHDRQIDSVCSSTARHGGTAAGHCPGSGTTWARSIPVSCRPRHRGTRCLLRVFNARCPYSTSALRHTPVERRLSSPGPTAWNIPTPSSCNRPLRPNRASGPTVLQSGLALPQKQVMPRAFILRHRLETTLPTLDRVVERPRGRDDGPTSAVRRRAGCGHAQEGS